MRDHNKHTKEDITSKSVYEYIDEINAQLKLHKKKILICKLESVRLNKIIESLNEIYLADPKEEGVIRLSRKK